MSRSALEHRDKVAGTTYRWFLELHRQYYEYKLTDIFGGRFLW
jgi:hypothetical protein